MTKYFINHPIPAIVFSIILTLLGILAILRLPVAEYPDIAPPTVNVSTSYLGADASVVNETVAQIIEPEINGLDGFDYMESNIDTVGEYGLTIFFKLGTDVNNAAVQVQNKIASVNSELPEVVQSSGVTVSKNTPESSLMVSLNSPNGTYDSVFLTNYAQIYFLDKIKRTNGVGAVNVFGYEYSMRIWLNPDKAAELNLSVNDIIAAIKEQNVRPAVGSIGTSPTANNQELEFIGRSENKKVTAEDFENIILKSDNNKIIYLKDVAKISVGPRNSNFITYQNGREAMCFDVSLTNSANTLKTIGEVKQILEEASKDFPPDMSYSIITDSTLFINESLGEVYETFIEALILVIITVWVFLQNFRTTLISLFAIPVSLIATFIFFPMLGFTLNTLTLFAMILAIGLVVDDAIVVIEVVEKKIDTGMEIKSATLEAMNEVQKPIIAISFVLAAVFIPVALLDGVTGELYKQFALTIVISMALSAFVALSLTPALCVLILRQREKKISVFDKFFEKVLDVYKNLLESFMRKKFLAFVLLIIFTVGATFLFQTLPSEYVPDEDKGTFAVAVSLPEGTALNRTAEISNKFLHEIDKLDYIGESLNIAGYDMLANGGSKSNGATIFANLKDWSEREQTLYEVLEEVDELGEKIIPEAKVFSMAASGLPGLESIGGVSLKILDVQGHTNEELADFAEKISIAAGKREELSDISIAFNLSTPYIDFKVDENKAKLLGVSMDDIYTALRVNFSGDEVNDFSDFGKNYKVVLRADKSFRNDVERAKFIFVKNADGEKVPLDTLVNFKNSTGPSIISRFNGIQCIGIEGNVGEGFSSSEAMDALEEVVEEVAPNTFQIEWSGVSRQEKESQSSITAVLFLSFVFVFLCLVALYESWKIPFAVLLSVPVGIFGALFGEVVMENMGSIYMQIGILVLVGLAAKNAILIVEVAKRNFENGESAEQSAISAAVERLRPILMTSFAFIVACIPLAVATGAGCESRTGMGVAVVGGMFFATLFGIFIVPILFSMIVGRKNLGIRI